jgi:ubiquinol-cytochrome c reductase cytochrome c1 subunit
MKKLIFILLAAFSLSTTAVASEGGIAWDKFPTSKLNDMASLQNGAKLFVNYCLNCHSAAFMRYNRLRDLGISEKLIKENLMFATDKVGDTMKATLDPLSAKEWFGGNPPDLTLITRSRSDGSKGTGADYLYTYLRSYYRDDTKPTGWNNLAYPNVGMPHVLWELQGQRNAKFVEEKDPHDAKKVIHKFSGYEQIAPGKLTSLEFDDAAADLVGYVQWMGEPAQGQRFRLGVWVMIFLAVFTLIAWRLNAAYWKDVK